MSRDPPFGGAGEGEQEFGPNANRVGNTGLDVDVAREVTKHGPRRKVEASGAYLSGQNTSLLAPPDTLGGEFTPSAHIWFDYGGVTL